MLWLVFAVAILQLSVVYLPPMQSFFNTEALSPMDLGIALGAGVIPFTAIAIDEEVEAHFSEGADFV